MSTNDLPDYGLEDDQDVPSYSTRRPLTPRTFTNRSLAVTLRSYAKSAESVPVFVKGAMLKGDIKFSPTARETIKEASVTVRDSRSFSWSPMLVNTGSTRLADHMLQSGH